MRLPRPLVKYGYNHGSNVLIIGLMMLFWSVFDGTVTFTTPIVITQAGYSEALMGIIIGSSSIAGAFFDFILCNILQKVVYRRVFLVMFSICLIYPFIILTAKSMLIFLLAMAMWGMYYDLKNFGIFNYIGHYTPRSSHAASFGVVHVFEALGYFIAPILVGILIGETVGWESYIMAWVFLAISLIFFLTLTLITRHGHPDNPERPQPAAGINVLLEMKAWTHLSRYIYPFLTVTLILSLVDGFAWTIGPLFSESLSEVHGFAGLLMAAFTLPPLFAGWFIGPIVRRFGKHHSAYLTLILGSLFIMLTSLFHSPFAYIAIFFLTSLFLALTQPNISGIYADIISRHDNYEKEIEGLEDFFTNLGYIVGPILAGVLAQVFGYARSFSLLGLVCFIIGMVMLSAGRKERHLPPSLISQSDLPNPA